MSLPLASEERCGAYKDSSLTAGEYAFSSLFGGLDIVFHQADLYACTVPALG